MDTSDHHRASRSRIEFLEICAEFNAVAGWFIWAITLASCSSIDSSFCSYRFSTKKQWVYTIYRQLSKTSQIHSNDINVNSLFHIIFNKLFIILVIYLQIFRTHNLMYTTVVNGDHFWINTNWLKRTFTDLKNSSSI